MTQVVTVLFQETLHCAAKNKNDHIMLTRIIGEDLIAVEAKYHRLCRKQYTYVSANETKLSDCLKDKEQANIYDRSFSDLCNKVQYDLIEGGKAFEMAQLLEMFKSHLVKNGMSEPFTETYSVRNLKKRLISKFGDKISFHKQHERNRSDLVCSSNLQLGEIINIVSELRAMMTDSPVNMEFADTPTRLLYHAAAILRAEIKDTKAICTEPLDIQSLSMETVQKIVPYKLQTFLGWLVQKSLVI